MREYEKIREIYNKLKLLHPKACRKIKIKSGKESYTINKQEVTLCLKDENDTYYNDNMLMYVAIHELAHVICDEVGHTPKFYAINDVLLEKAEKLNIYDPKIPIIQDYCNY